MDSVKRGAESQYPTLNLKAIKEMKVKDISADNSVLILWVPGSLLQEGLDVMSAWGFNQKQIHVWVKTKKRPLEMIEKIILRLKRLYSKTIKKKYSSDDFSNDISVILNEVKIFDASSSLAFGMGRLFRQTHEIALVGTRGKIYNKLKNKSQRSVHFGPVMKHSAKPECLQEMLEIMFP